MKRQPPAWKFQGVPFHDLDGSVLSVNDFPAALVARMERAAQAAGMSFDAFYTTTIAEGVERLWKEERGF